MAEIDLQNTKVAYDKTSGSWDLSVAKGKNQTKQAKLTANTADHTAANLVLVLSHCDLPFLITLTLV